VNHDIRLFATQTLLALMSSPISWIGNGITFSMVGYSMGGPISLAFAGAFPSSVRSMVLFGPAGLLRKLPEGYDDPILLNPPSQEALRDKVQEVLGVNSSGPALNNSETAHPVPPLVFPWAVNQIFDLPALLQWQFDHNEGHIHAFQESTKYGPLQHQEDVWTKTRDIFAGKTHPESPLYDSTLLVYFGDEDNIVVGNETTEDILRLLPANHLKVEYVPGSHSFPYPNSETIAQGIISFWGSKGCKL
jgi:pimeloyl-ACP methyl ester carboxylesterase